MKAKKGQDILIVALIVFAIIYFWYQHQEKEQLRQTLKDQDHRLQNLESSLWHTGRAFAVQTELVNQLAQRVPNLDETVLETVNQLNELAFMMSSIAPEVAHELTSAGNLIKAEEMVKSVATMANVIENLLKTWLCNDPDFKDRYKKKLDNSSRHSINLGNLIDYASEKNLLSNDDITLLNEVKEIRNESAHELAVQKAKTYLINCQERCVDFVKGIIPRLSVSWA